MLSRYKDLPPDATVIDIFFPAGCVAESNPFETIVVALKNPPAGLDYLSRDRHAVGILLVVSTA